MIEDWNRNVAIIGGARTPFAKAGGELREYAALDLATHAVNGAIEKVDLDPLLVDEVAVGSVIVDPATAHLAREVNFRSDLPANVRALTVTDNCITGTSAIQSVFASIAMDLADIGIAGGTESMSNPPLVLGTEASRILNDARRDARFGLMSVCGAGGTAAAVLLERP